MNPTGRPTKLDDLTAKRICDAIATGNTRRCAATAAGVTYTTIKHWLQRGRAGEEPFAAFLARLEKADAEAEAKAVKVIVDAAQAGTWQAAAWWLERRRSDRWARRETTGAEDRTRRDDARVRAMSDDELRSTVRQHAAAVLTPADLRRALAEAEARTAGGGAAS
jgi:transposase